LRQQLAHLEKSNKESEFKKLKRSQLSNKEAMFRCDIQKLYVPFKIQNFLVINFVVAHKSQQ